MMRLMTWMLLLACTVWSPRLGFSAETPPAADPVEAATEEATSEQETAEQPEQDSEEASEEAAAGTTSAEASGDPSETAQEPTDQEAAESADGNKEKKKDDQGEAKEEEAEKKDGKKKDADPPAKRKTYTIEPKPLKITVTVAGDLVAQQQTEVKLDAESWSKFEIEEIVPHGARVTSGQVLVQFDPDPLLEAIEDRELTQRLGEISLIKAEKALPRLEESLERDLRDAQRNWDEAQEDYQQYTDEERELIVRSYDSRLKKAKFDLDYVKDELEQLQKMYEADDLTEETEELVLARHKTQYELAQFSYEIAKYNHDLVLGVYLPRQDVQLKESQRYVELALERAKEASELELTRARYDLEKLRRSRTESLEKHAELLSDKGWMTLKSPASGIVYYGRCVNGKWSQIKSYKDKLLPGKSAPNRTVLMTIVDPAKMRLLGSVGEKDLPTVQVGQDAEVSLKAEGVEPIVAQVAQLEMTPSTQGKFEIVIDLTGEKPKWLVPGMTGKAEVVTYHNKQALLVPREAVHEDEEQERKFVWLVKEEEVTKQWVETGRGDKKHLEVTDGLSDGDLVSLDDESKKDDAEDAEEDSADDDSSDD